MDYELAKELKEAGFPQKEDRTALYPHGYGFSGTKKGIKQSQIDRAYPPTLEELIEACNTTFSIYIEGHGADATQAGSEITGSGDTPTEAVARLWLALKSK